MLRALPVVLALAILSLAFAVPAHAVLITVNFAWGNFSFDSSIIPTGGGTVGDLNLNTDYATSMSVIDALAAGQVWDSSNAGVNYLVFDSNGNLTEWALGGDLNGIYGLTLNSSPDMRFSVLGGVQFAQATNPGGWISGTPLAPWSFSPQPPYGGAAPEPASWLLFGGAIVGLVGVRWRARK